MFLRYLSFITVTLVPNALRHLFHFFALLLLNVYNYIVNHEFLEVFERESFINVLIRSIVFSQLGG